MVSYLKFDLINLNYKIFTKIGVLARIINYNWQNFDI